MYQLGPLLEATPSASDRPDLLLHLTLALLFLGLLWPVFRCIRALIAKTKDFAEHAKPMTTIIEKGLELVSDHPHYMRRQIAGVICKN